ncbi:MAG: methyltransferase domain-containing protein [Saprospiraceae bacterium]|jgi:thiopurine S-methyltransferase|nr:methyltransferase domain-containing protein [Saprospiraceae bacterium]MBL0025474.1 methyltransferase domain-containing protein [Saprospiraceae bacterium]
MIKLDRNYWDTRHRNEDTPWKLGEISPPLKNYFDQLTDKSIRILIPGAGHAFEAKYLAQTGFNNITICDISTIAIEILKNELTEFKTIKYLEGDFLEINGQFDLIVEQTFFCALDPSYREAYVEKMYQLLKEKGTLVGLLFGSYFDKPGPPFGGDIKEYNSLLSKKLHIHQLQMCYNSITQRQGNELFIICKKHKQL